MKSQHTRHPKRENFIDRAQHGHKQTFLACMYITAEDGADETADNLPIVNFPSFREERDKQVVYLQIGA